MTRDGRKIERRITRNDAVGADDRNPRIGAGAQTIGNEMRPTETAGRFSDLIGRRTLPKSRPT
jgi:hypothetical protein